MWFHGQREHLKQCQKALLAHEQEASQIRMYEPLNVPGLLQTEGYKLQHLLNMAALPKVSIQIVRKWRDSGRWIPDGGGPVPTAEELIADQSNGT